MIVSVSEVPASIKVDSEFLNQLCDHEHLKTPLLLIYQTLPLSSFLLCQYKVPIFDVIHLNAYYSIPLYAASHDARCRLTDRCSTYVGQFWPFLYSPLGVFFLAPVTSIIMLRTKKLHFSIKIPAIPETAFASGV